MTDDLVKQAREFAALIMDGVFLSGSSTHDLFVGMSDRIEQLEAALQRIADEAFSPQDDDVIWMDDDTPLGQFIDKELQCAALAGEKKDE